VFADLGIKNPEEYLAKSELAAQIQIVIKARGLTQAAAGALLGIEQPKVSTLLSGRLDGFSTDRLLRFLTLLGSDIKISVSKPHSKKIGQVSVLSPMMTKRALTSARAAKAAKTSAKPSKATKPARK